MVGGLFFSIFGMSQGKASFFLDLLSAVGTVSAAGIALYLSSLSSSKSEMAERAKAELSAAKLTPILSSILVKVEALNTARCFSADAAMSESFDLFDEFSELKPLVDLVSIGSLESLACLENNCANRIARAIGNIQQLVISVETSREAPWDELSWFRKVSDCAEWFDTISTVRQLLHVSLNTCYVTSGRAAPMPGDHERTWDVDTLD